MTAHSALDQRAVTLSTFSWNGSVARNFKLSVSLPLTEIWYYSGAGCVLPSKCALYDDAGVIVPGTLKTSPVWSGPAGSGWVKTDYDGSIMIPANLLYQANCYVNGTAGFDSIIGNPVIVNGLIYDSLSLYDAASINDISYISGANLDDFLVDVGVASPDSFSVSDNFDRPDGPLGNSWQATPDSSFTGSIAIVSDRLQPTTASANALSFWKADAVSDNQYAEAVLSVLPGAGDWIALSLRVSGDGKSRYLCIVWNNAGVYTLQMFTGNGAGGYISLATGTFAAVAGDTFRFEAFEKNLTAFINGVPMIMAQDTTLSWGQPGIESFGASAVLDNWSAGTVTIDPVIQLTGTSGHVFTYSVNTPINRHVLTAPTPSGPQDMRVLTPTNPNPAYAHAFLWLLPVEPGQGVGFGDPIAHVQSLGYQDAYNLTCIQPGFPIDPWYADNDTDPGTRQEMFMIKLVAWAKGHLAVTGSEANYLIGFSKSGVGGQRLFWRNQDLFTAVASWDFPPAEQYADFTPGSVQVYGSQNNFDTNYKVDSTHLTTWKASGDTGSKNRVWIGDTQSFDDSGFDTTLTTDTILHTYAHNTHTVHNWVSSPDWMDAAIVFLAGVGPPPSGGLLMATIV